MKFFVTKSNSGLKPSFDVDMEVYIKIPVGETWEIEYKKVRNYEFHKKFFALIKLAFDNQEAYKLINSMREDLIIHAGYSYEDTNFITGEVKTKAKSIAFQNMDEIEFSKLYESVKNVISQWLGLENENIDLEIQQYY